MNQNLLNIIDMQCKTYHEKYKGKGSYDIIDTEDIQLTYDNNSISIKSLKKLDQGCEYRLKLLLPYFYSYINQYQPKPFEIIISLGDIAKHQYSIPCLSFSRKRSINSILIPNIDFFTGAIYQFFQEVDNNDIAFESKNNSAIFIGSSTGSFDNNTRIRFCQQSINNNKIKAYIHNLCQAEKSEWIARYPDIESYLHTPISISDQLKHKIVVNIDGNTMCWSRLYWQMRSDSIPLYVDKTQEDIQFFDYVDSSETYVSCSLENSIDTITEILQYPIQKIDKINIAGKHYFNQCFSDYMHNPQEFLQTIINYTLDKINQL